MVLKTPMKRKHHEMEAPPEEQEDENAEDLEWYDNEGTTVDGIYIPPAAKPACSFDSKGPRLIITKIVNNFFKSYAGEQTLGPFHKCFNAIVGPNGSGKSNVIDSMLFVFGYRATKIRSKKVSVLLHSSAKYQNVQSCKVSVHFCEIIDKPGDDYDILPNSGFVVSRIANKDNSSYYELNGRRVQFKEVAMLLRKHGVDLDHNRFLILQGEVEQIAMMKCKGENENETGMLEYLEDIIGTSRYKQPLLKLNERVEVLSEQRIEKVNRLKLVSKVLEDLTEPMKEAVNFLKTENTVVYCKNILYQKNIYDLEQKIKDTEEEKSKIDEVQSGLMEKLNALAAEKSEKDKILKHESAKYEHLQKKKDSLKETFDKANNKDIQLQSDMTQLNTNRKKTKELLAEERKKLAELELVPEKSAKGIEECEAKEKELLAKKEVLEQEKVKQLASLRLETQELQQRKEVIQTELLELNKAVVVAKKAYSLAESELKIYVSNEENERKKYEQLKEAFEEVQKTLQEREEAVSQLKNQLPLTRQSLNSALQELNEVRDQESKLQNECRRKRMSLEESKSSMQASRSRGKVLDALMQQKRQGNCPGLFGRLGDLGAINQKYDVAISTACGPLDNMVVDTVSTGEWCIEFLKKYNVGRATFICLDKQEHLRNLANSKIRTPENVHRLYDLITVEDDRIRTAFYYALRDTLVADDLEQATRIAYGAQRFRVVTLQGAVIETSGTMSGGGKTVSRGRMGQKVATSNVDPKVLESLESEVNNFEENIRNLQQKQGGLENQVNALQPQLRKMETDYEKFIAEIQSLQKQKPTLEHQLKSQATISKKTKANPEQVKKLEAAVMKMKTEYEAALANTVDLQTEVDALTKEIKDKTFGKIKNLDKNLNEVSKTIDKCKAEITRLRVAVTTSKRNYKKSADKVATMEQDIVNYETKLREMKALREEIEGDAEKLLACIKEIEEKLVEGQEEYSDIKEAVNKLTKEENKLKGEKVEVDHKIKTFEKKLKELNASIHQWHVKVSQLKLQDVCNEQAEPLKQLTVEELENKNIEAVEKELLNAEAQLKLAKPNLNAIQEYQRQKATFVERSEELDEITSRRARMRELYDGLRSRRKEEFTTGYNIIRLKLKEMYQMITLGGDADFEMMDSFDPFTEGIQLNVRPPKKSWKVISNLSGGEKTLSSLALVFALHYYRPSPLYVMDEIDAALDFKNVSIVGHYIKERTKNAQFIIISLRSNMFELCDNLVGIYKTYECTQSITIDPRIYDQSNTDGSRHNQEEAIGLQDANTPEHNVTDNTCQNAARSQNTINNGEGLVDSNPTEENQNEDEVPSTEDVNMINLENNSMTSSNSEPKLNSDNDKTIDDSLDEAMECD